MIWCGISIGRRIDLHIFQNDILMVQRYADEILSSHVIPYAAAIGDSFVFLHDIARSHTACLVENMLKAEIIQRMEWSRYFPDLNPIEHVWNMLGRRTNGRTKPPFTLRDVEIALLEGWNSISQILSITSSRPWKTGVQKS